MYLNKSKSHWRITTRLCSVASALGAMMLTAQIGPAQVVNNCTPELAAGTQVTPTVAHIGDTIGILGVKAGTSGGDCDLVNVSAWLVDPNNSVQLVFTNGAIPSGNCASCPSGFSSCIGTENCIPGVNFTYVVSGADINQPLSFTPPGGLGSASLGAVPHYIQFMPVGTGIVPPGGNESGNNVKGQGQAKVLIVTPSISVTKSCASNCTPYGAPVVFIGTVCNTGDDTLIGVNVTDNPAAAITFSTTTSYATNGFPASGGGRLLPGECVNFTGSYQPTNNFCGPFTDTVIASGTESASGPFEFQVGGGGVTFTNTLTVFATNSATCEVCQTIPCIAVTKNCNPSVITNNPAQDQFGTVTFTGYVTNCGNVPLTNVTVFDSFLGKTILTVPFLTNGASVSYTTNFLTTSNECGGTFTNTVIARGNDQCDGRGVTNNASCEFTVVCVQPPPNIGITKQVACFLGTNESGMENCGTFSNSAVGVRSDTDDPAFCYQITVTNPGPVALTNVSVIDTVYGDLTADFSCVSQSAPPQFPVGASCSFTFKASVGQDLTNVVNDSGFSIVSGQKTNASANAVVTVYPASVTCLKQYTIDGGPLTNNAVLPDANSHTIIWYVTVSNPSTNVNLGDVVVADVTANLGCVVTIPPFSLDAGSNIIFAVCTNNNVACSNGFDGITNVISITASNFSLGTNHMPVCSIDINGSNIVVSSTCEAFLGCSHPGACRVTGGGRQDAPNVFPANVRYVTHGGQVGAPVGDAICIVTSQFPIGNPCIHGRWTHVRHMQGGLEGNFHARFYDTLQCACLDTNLTPVPAILSGVDGASAQTYTNLVYGPGTTVDSVCNPGDRIAGPEPSPAPANKIVFTGVGDYALTQGNRVPISVLFRVDVEDRGEPGGSHPGGGKPPPDRNRTRIWILTPTELTELRGGGADPLLLNFRNAISACNGINVQDGASVTNGAPAFGVRQPDIDDGGELDRGNYQIHPTIMNCDPNNPVGPGLAKP